MRICNQRKAGWYFPLLANQGTIEHTAKSSLHLKRVLAPSLSHAIDQMPSPHLFIQSPKSPAFSFFYIVAQMPSLHPFISAITTQNISASTTLSSLSNASSFVQPGLSVPLNTHEPSQPTDEEELPVPLLSMGVPRA